MYAQQIVFCFEFLQIGCAPTPKSLLGVGLGVSTPTSSVEFPFHGLKPTSGDLVMCSSISAQSLPHSLFLSVSLFVSPSLLSLSFFLSLSLSVSVSVSISLSVQSVFCLCWHGERHLHADIWAPWQKSCVVHFYILGCFPLFYRNVLSCLVCMRRCIYWMVHKLHRQIPLLMRSQSSLAWLAWFWFDAAFCIRALEPGHFSTFTAEIYWWKPDRPGTSLGHSNKLGKFSGRLFEKRAIVELFIFLSGQP